METQIATIGLILLETKKYVIIEEIKIVHSLQAYNRRFMNLWMP